MIEDTHDGWYIVPWNDRLIQESEQSIWCRERFGEEKNGTWDRTWAGFAFKNESDYVMFKLRWS